MFFSRKKPVIRPRSAHCISRKNINPDALRVLYRLADAGHTAYLVGGSVRDLLMGRAPKDFDVSTDAHPNTIRKLFRNCFLVGRRFRLAHIVFGQHVIETSTFRRQPKPDEANAADATLYQHEDNTFGTPEEDALRRDFTVNGLFYDIKTFSVIDYVGGLKDLETQTLRCIGDPNVRFREDPVRMMRAVRFAARLGFRIDWSSRRAIRRHHAEIVQASVPRLLEEVMRLFTYRSAEPAFRLLWEYGLLGDIIPELAAFVNHSGRDQSPVWSALHALDADTCADEASGGLRLAVLCYPVFRRLLEEETRNASGMRVNRLHVARKTFEPFVRRLRIPKAVFFTATSLIDLLPRFEEVLHNPARRERFVNQAIFPEALALWRIVHRAVGETPPELAEWEAAARAQVRRRPEEDEADESDAAWRAASGAEEDKPRAGFHGGRRRHRPRGERKHHATDAAGDDAPATDQPPAGGDQSPVTGDQ